MRFPSIETAVQDARDTLNRFPMAILSALGAAVVALVLIAGPTEDRYWRLLATLILGLSLFTASVTTAERRGIPPRRRWLADLAIGLGLALVYRTSLGWTDQLAALRFIQLLVVAHLLVAVGPYLGRGGLRGFWQYNRFLFLRYLVATLHAGVLWVGLAVALAAVDKLFGVGIDSERYAQLWAILAFGFHPWFFLGGVPRDHAELDRLEDYPGGLKVFTQYVLIPLVAIYLVILTAYLGKIGITRTWPSGWIGYLVSSVSATGVLALLLVHPIREREDSKWVRAYGRWWFAALLPSLVMLLLAISKRIGQYGVTEPRYFLLVLTLWLLALAVYYVWTGSDNIKLIPTSLALVALLTAIGPWGAYSVSRHSQTARFDRILAANAMGRAGAVTAARGPVSFEDRRQLSAVVRYLHRTHGSGTVAGVLGAPLDTVLTWEHASKYGSDDPIAFGALDRLGVKYVGRWEAGGRGIAPTNFWASVGAAQKYEVAGFEVARSLSYPSLGWVGTATDSLELSRGAAPGSVVVKHAGAPIFTLDLNGAVRAALPDSSELGGRGMTLERPIMLEGESEGYRVRLYLDHVNGAVVGTGVQVQAGNVFVLVGGFGGRRVPR